MAADNDAALLAAAHLLRSLATSDQKRPSQNGVLSHVKLPGPPTAASKALEHEIFALMDRISQLETRASAASSDVFPDTPSEPSESPFAASAGGPASSASSAARPALRGLRQSSSVTHETLETLREQVAAQDKLLEDQRQVLANVNAQLLDQKQAQESAINKLEHSDMKELRRELTKHQNANQAFQTALREIGDIVTAVARGDLSRKVMLSPSDRNDPEIETFKLTINTMVDQLQVFSSEVSRVAREVGTEGMLGGQARIEGVDGTWKELTDNGKRALPCLIHTHLIRANHNLPFSERHGTEPH